MAVDQAPLPVLAAVDLRDPQPLAGHWRPVQEHVTGLVADRVRQDGALVHDYVFGGDHFFAIAAGNQSTVFPTWQAVLHAVRELFTVQGYTATTVDQIAGRAAVSKPTVFAAAGSKQAILKQLRDIALAGDEPVPVAQRSRCREALAEPDRAGPFAWMRAASRPSTAGPPTCTKYSGRQQNQVKTCTSCGAPARTNGAAAR